MARAPHTSLPQHTNPPSSHPPPTPNQQVELQTPRSRCVRARLGSKVEASHPACHRRSSPAVQALTAQLAPPPRQSRSLGKLNWCLVSPSNILLAQPPRGRQQEKGWRETGKVHTGWTTRHLRYGVG